MALAHGGPSCQTPAGGGVAADALVYGYTHHSAPPFFSRTSPSRRASLLPASLSSSAHRRAAGEKGVG